jgi:tetratricopeptide (TPR) repeat protein
MDPSGRGSRANGPLDPVAIEVLVASINTLFNEVPHAGNHTGHLRRQLKILLNTAPKQWQQMPEVLYACGRCYGELGDFTKAIHYLSRAVAIEDKKGRVPVKAVEQLANFEARKGSKGNNPIELIHNAITRLRSLTRAAGGTDAGRSETGMAVNSERCALLGSAYKRLAGKLDVWSMESDDPHIPQGIQQALTLSAQWYATGEGNLHQPDFNAYNAQNRIALQAVLGTATPEDAKLARHAGQLARERFVNSREFWDMIMVGDGELIAGMIDESLMKAPRRQGEFDAARAIINRYTELTDQLPKSMREFDSVVKQILLLKDFVQQRAAAEKRKAPKLKILAKNLGRIAAALDPSTAAGAGTTTAEPSSSDAGDQSPLIRAGHGRLRKAKPKPASKTKGRSR